MPRWAVHEPIFCRQQRWSVATRGILCGSRRLWRRWYRQNGTMPFDPNGRSKMDSNSGISLHDINFVQAHNFLFFYFFFSEENSFTNVPESASTEALRWSRLMLPLAPVSAFLLKSGSSILSIMVSNPATRSDELCNISRALIFIPV